MKKINLFAMLALVSGFLFTACDEETAEPNNDVTIEGIPATAEIENLGTLGPVTATITAEDGLASVVVTKDGDTYLEPDFEANATSLTLDFSYTAVEADADKNIVFEFTATDVDGDEETVTHVLSVGEAPTERVITESISEDVTWTNDVVYRLGGRIFVLDGATLTIEPGTIIKGEAGTGTNATALVVARGGKLMAEGTADAPIIFTSVADEIESGMIASPNLDPDIDGLWGGLIVLGYAPISTPDGVAQIEGIPPSDTNGLYGGGDAADPADNSGVLKYISIRHGGANIGEGNEINGLTLGGVGTGTVIENIEIIANQDDGIEPFGGSVNVTNLLVWNSYDDSFDCDQDYTGTIDNFIGILGVDSDHGMELDGPEGALDEGGYTLINGSIKGSLDASGGEYADLRDGAATRIENVYFFNFKANSDFELDDAGSVENYTTGRTVLRNLQFNVSHLSEGNRTIADIFNDTTGSGAFDNITEDEAKIVTAPTTGADKSAFAGWTWADVNGELADF